jgi:hypothetical protein
MVMTVGSSGIRGLQSVDIEKIDVPVPSVKISGVAQLLQALNSASDFTNAAFDVITLDSFTQKATEQGVVYEGKLTIVNDQGVNVTGIINGAWDQVNNKFVLTASKYEVETEETEEELSDVEDGNNTPTSPDDGYTQLDIEAAKNDPQVSAAFDWAVEELIETGERQNKIPLSQYNVTAWTWAAYKNTPKGVNYKFVAELLGANYVHVETSMTVFYRNANQSYKLAGYYYKATNITKGMLPNNFTDIDNNNNTNSTNITDTTPIVPPGYTYLSAEDLANNTQAQAALQSGVKALIEKGISQYKIPAASPEYNITNLISAAYKNQNFGATYLFNVNLTNALNYKVDTNLTISYRAATQTFKLVAYKFYSYNYPKSAIVIPPKNNTDANNSTNTTIPDNSTVVPPVNETQSVDNSTVVVPPVNETEPVDNSTVVVPPVNETLPVDNSTVVPPVNETLPVDNSTVVPPVNETEPVANNTVPPTNNTVPVNQTVPEGFTLITAEQLANDSQAQAALQSGVNALIQKAVSQNKIPAKNANYTVSNLILAASKKQAIGVTYKFQVNTTNADNVKVDASLNVLYRYSTKEFSLNGYSFRSYNYSNKDLAKNNNNTAAPVVNNTTSTVDTTAPVVADNNTVVANSTVVDVNDVL